MSTNETIKKLEIIVAKQATMIAEATVLLKRSIQGAGLMLEEDITKYLAKSGGKYRAQDFDMKETHGEQ